MRFLAVALGSASVLWGGCGCKNQQKVEAAACFLDPASGRRATPQSAFTMPLNVIVLYSPGYHCGACVRGVRNWDQAINRLPKARLSSHVVVDGTQTSAKAADLLAKSGALKSHVWLDRMVPFDPP